jgi:UDP-2,4-diacetamido-2,4,6-trideoxy-beta-L-altropyranose hydrolase
MNRIVYFRADANSQIGLGHIYRCCAVAQMLSDESECILVTQEINDYLYVEMSRYFRKIIIIEDTSKELWLSKLQISDIVVLDGYHFNAEYQLKIRPRCKCLICIDDIHSYHFYADIVINHAGGLNASVYDTETYTKLYLGPAFAMIRSSFWNKPSTPSRLSDHVFVCLGGADPKNDLIKILSILVQNNSVLQYHIVTGSGYKYEEQLSNFLSNYNFLHHYKNLDSIKLKEVMSNCAIAVVSPSTVSYEYLSIGGELYLYPIADNQESIYQYFIKEELAFAFDEYRVSDNFRVNSMIKKQGEVFDGKSYLRIKEIILNG